VGGKTEEAFNGGRIGNQTRLPARVGENETDSSNCAKWKASPGGDVWFTTRDWKQPAEGRGVVKKSIGGELLGSTSNHKSAKWGTYPREKSGGP